MNLTTEQQQAIESGQAVPVNFGETHCVVIRKDVYERVASLLGDFEPQMGYEAFREAAGEEWNDPALDVYEQYRKKP